MDALGQKLRLACYHASDGPRIMILGPLDADFYSLQALFARLGRSAGESYELHDQPFVAAFGATKISLTSTGTMFAHKQGIRQVEDAEGPAFTWRRTAEGWDYLTKLIDPIVTGPHPGHQYLTRYPDEDAIVVVSKGEYTDDVLEQH